MKQSALNRRDFMHAMGLMAATASFTSITGCAAKQKPNILFLAIDDLRPELGCYDHPKVLSPDIDKLAAMSTKFTNAFCNVPVCGASRASLLTGIRPTRDKFVTYYTRMEEDTPNATTIHKYFGENGYYTVSLGKVTHHQDDNDHHWTEKPWHPSELNPAEGPKNWRDYITEANINAGKKRGNGSALPYEMPDVEDNAYFDGKTADKAIEELNRLTQRQEPFMLAVGFLKPHLPFNAPKKYWDLYDRDNITLPDNYYRPENAPDAALHNFGELRAYMDIPGKGPVSDDMAKTLIHGYMACVSYTDAQIGRVLKALEKSGQADNTIIVLWGDHGWNLGEHTLWCKHCNFKTSLQVPMLVKAPGMKENQQTAGLTEYVDIFPTLCDLAGLPIPDQCEGDSFVPLLKNPDRSWKPAVYSQWHDGATVKTRDYAYTEWTQDDGTLQAQMLYDHRNDPDENINIVDKPENQEMVKKMKTMLEQGWKPFKP